MKATLATWLSVLLVSTNVRGEVKLPAIFSDHMVLQADKPVAVWGWADADEEITVSFAGQSKSAKADSKGKWALKLDPMPASRESRVMTVRGSNPQSAIRDPQLKDVLMGEVWLASGQSNMEMQIKGRQHGAVANADQEIAAANHPGIRMFIPSPTYDIYDLSVPPAEPMSDRPGTWRVCSPQTVADFSAMGYFFARDLQKELRVPVGIVSSSVGGTPIEAWTSRSAQDAVPALKPVLEDWQKRLAGHEPAQEQKTYLAAKQRWLKERSEATKAGQPAPKAPAPFKNLQVSTPGGLFNGMIAPYVPFTMRGVIWYQGERNAAGPFTGMYGLQLQTLIKDWRARWDEEFYFAWVQLPGFQKEQRLPSEPNGWGVAVRDEMRKTLSVPRTGMAITIDLGGATAGHPTNKLDFAARLSPVVLHDVYARPTPEWSGPLFRSAQRDGEKMVLTFDHATGLKASLHPSTTPPLPPASDELRGFAIAGDNQKFVWAKTRIEGGKIIVWSETVNAPAAVRYGWAANPNGNLVNGAGLPASPFRTDDWK